MATNITRELGDQLAVTVSHPTTPTSGSPVRWGVKAGVALTDEDTVTGKTTVKFNGCAALTVKGIDGSGNSAVATGDALYYTDADTPPVSKKATGTLIGHAVDTVASGATGTNIEVRLAG
jgi:hypothetical protein